MTKLVEQVLLIAEGELGKGEEGDNNSGPVIEKYLNGLAESPANWCAAFVSWCFKEASPKLWTSKGYLPSMPFRYTLSAKAIYNDFKFRHWVESDPECGDLIFFWRESPSSWMGHIGIVTDVLQNSIKTIEGNKGVFPAKVARYSYNYPIPQLLGYGRIPE